MNIRVSKESVLNARQIVQQTQQALVQNHSVLVSEVEQNLQEWNDANVTKFLANFQNVTQDMSEIIIRLNAIDSFCIEVYNWLCLYLDA
ncbi:MAG: hypothetical protein ACI4MI_02860 [Christensenellales bacterium]